MELVSDRANSALMDNRERGQAIQERLDRLGVSDRTFYERTGIDRKTLRRAVEAEQRVRPATYAAIEAAIDKMESLVRGEPVAQSDPQVVTFHLRGNFGVDVVVSGPVSDLDALEAAVERLLNKMGPSQD